MKTYETIKAINASKAGGRNIELPRYMVYGNGYPAIAKDFKQARDIARKRSEGNTRPVKIVDMLVATTSTLINGRPVDDFRNWVYCYKQTDGEPILIRVKEIESHNPLEELRWARDYNRNAEPGCYAICMTEDINGNVKEDTILNDIMANPTDEDTNTEQE